MLCPLSRNKGQSWLAKWRCSLITTYMIATHIFLQFNRLLQSTIVLFCNLLQYYDFTSLSVQIKRYHSVQIPTERQTKLWGADSGLVSRMLLAASWSIMYSTLTSTQTFATQVAIAACAGPACKWIKVASLAIPLATLAAGPTSIYYKPFAIFIAFLIPAKEGFVIMVRKGINFLKVNVLEEWIR